MWEHGFSLARIILYMDKIEDTGEHRRIRVRENLYSRIIYAVFY